MWKASNCQTLPSLKNVTRNCLQKPECIAILTLSDSFKINFFKNLLDDPYVEWPFSF